MKKPPRRNRDWRVQSDEFGNFDEIAFFIGDKCVHLEVMNATKNGIASLYVGLPGLTLWIGRKQNGVVVVNGELHKPDPGIEFGEIAGLVRPSERIADFIRADEANESGTITTNARVVRRHAVPIGGGTVIVEVPRRQP